MTPSPTSSPGSSQKPPHVNTSSLPPSRSSQSLLLSPIPIETPVAQRIPYEAKYGETNTIQDPYHYLREPSKERDVYLSAESKYHQQITQTYSQLSKTVQGEMENITEGAQMTKGELANFWQMKEHIYWLEQGHSLKRCHEEAFNNTNVSDGELLYEIPRTGYMATIAYTVGHEEYRITVIDANGGHRDTKAKHYETMVFLDDDTILFDVADHLGVPKFIDKLNIKNDTITRIYAETEIWSVPLISRSSDGKLVMVRRYGQRTSGYLLFDESDSLQEVFPAKTNVQIELDHGHDMFYLRTNEDHVNYSLKRSSSTTGGWETIHTASEDTFLEFFKLYENHIVLWTWKAGHQEVTILSAKDANIINVLRFKEEPVYAVYLSAGTDSSLLFQSTNYHGAKFFYTYSSHVTPPRTYTYDMEQSTSTLITEVSYPELALSDYSQTRLSISSTLQITIVHPKIKKATPIYIGSYGSYGDASPIPFDTSIFPFLIRGGSYAYCHVRGDATLGSQQYLGGCLANKVNTMIDVRTCVEALLEGGWTFPGGIAVGGRSAGGLIVGNAATWKDAKGAKLVDVVVGHVPFVDPISGLSSSEDGWVDWERFEFGDPVADPNVFQSMMKYSPYELLKEGMDLPHVFLTGGVEDTRVPYWEPLKYIAKLRYSQRSGSMNKLVLAVHERGHFGGESGGDVWGFVLIALGMCDPDDAAHWRDVVRGARSRTQSGINYDNVDNKTDARVRR